MRRFDRADGVFGEPHFAQQRSIARIMCKMHIVAVRIQRCRQYPWACHVGQSNRLGYKKYPGFCALWRHVIHHQLRVGVGPRLLRPPTSVGGNLSPSGKPCGG